MGRSNIDLSALINELNRLKLLKDAKLNFTSLTHQRERSQESEENQVVYTHQGKFNKETGDLLPKSSENKPQSIKMYLGIRLWNWPKKIKI